MTQLMRGLSTVIGFCLAVLILSSGLAEGPAEALSGSDGRFDVAVIEHLRIQVPCEGRQAWLDAERGSWEPWLAQQQGFLGRDLLWDPNTEEGTLLIRWSSRDAWKAIPIEEVEAVQQRFETLAREAIGQAEGNPFPLVFEGELLPA